MATFASFIDSAANLTVSADERTYTITGDWNWDGALDDNAFPRGNDGITIILSGSSAKLRCSAGASGVFGGYSQPIRIIERGDAHAYPDDNGNPASPTDCRFVGVGTSIWDNIIWEVEPRSSGNARSDFDVGRNYSGTFRGFRLIQKWASGQSTPFNHIYSSNLKLEIDQNGIGYSIRNERNAHAMIIESNPNAQFEGLASDNVAIPVNTRNEGATAGSSARIVVNVPANTTFTLVGLDTATLTQSSNNSTSICILRDPVQVPTLTNNWNSPAGATMIIERTQPFQFNGAVPTGTLYADAQNSNGADVNVAVPASGAVGIPVRTHYVPYTGNSSGGTWDTSVDSYQFYWTGFGAAKYYSGSTNISVGTNPTTRSVNLTAVALPDGTALSSKTSGAVETAADIINALHTYEVSNPTYPSLSQRLLSFSGDTVSINTAELVLSTSASDFITRSSNTITLQCDSGGVDASNGVGLLNLGGSYNAPSGTLNLIGFPTTSSQGTSALLNISAPISQVYAYTSSGTQLGNRTLASAGTTSFLIPANQAAADTKVGCGRAGRPPQSRNIDTSAGGTFNVEFQDLAAEVDANGDALYDSSVTKPSISFIQSGSSSGQATFLIGNQSYTPKGLYRALHDQFSNPLGGRYVAFGRTPLQILELGGALPNAVFLGGDTQLRRASSSGSNAAVNGFVFGGIGGNRVNEDRGSIQLGASGSGGGGADVAGIWNALTDTYQAAGSFGEKLGELSSAVLSVNRYLFNTPFTDDTAISAITGTTIPNDASGRGWGVLAGAGTLVFNDSGTGVLENGTLLFGTHRPGFTSNAELDFVFQHRVTSTHSNASAVEPVARIVNSSGDEVFGIYCTPGISSPAYLLRITDGSNVTNTVLTSSSTQNNWNTLAVSIRQDGSYAEVRATFNGGTAVTQNVSSDVRELSISNASRAAFTAADFSELRNIFFCPRGTQSSATGWTPPAGLNWDETNRTYSATDGSVLSSVPTPTGGGGSTDLTATNAKIDAVKSVADNTLTRADVIIEQNKLTMQNLPRHFYSPWVPENPAVFFVYGQLRLHDVNKRNWQIENPDNRLVIAQNGDGFGTFDGSTLVRASLNRENAQGTLVNFAEECTAAFRIKPIDEDGTFIVAELGAMRLNLVMSGGTGTLQVGSVGAQNYSHATITAGMQHDIILTFQRNTRDGAGSYPIVRLSASNGYADDGITNSPNVQTLQTWNVDTNEVFGAIASHTGYFNFGHSGGSGFKGDMSNVYFHPSATAINYTWEVGNHAQAAGFNTHKQIWHGLPCDSSEGLSDDLLEETAEDTNDKVNEIPQNTAAAVASRSLAGQTATKDGLLGERIKWLTDNLNADSTATIVDAVYNEGASDHNEADSFGALLNALPTTAPDSKEDIADAVLDELLSGHTTTGSLGKVLADTKTAVDAIPTTTYTIPSATDNATAVWSATTSSNNTTGSMGARLQETSTHGAPADSPAATDVAKATWDYLTSATLVSGSFGEHVAGLANAPSAADVATAARNAMNNQVIFGGVTRLQKEQRELTRDQGTFVIVGNQITFTPHNSAGPTIVAPLSDTQRGASTITEGD